MSGHRDIMGCMKKKAVVVAAPPPDQRKFVGVSFRTRTVVPELGSLQDRLEIVLAAMAKRACGIPPKANNVAKSAFERGLALIEKELGIS